MELFVQGFLGHIHNASKGKKLKLRENYGTELQQNQRT